MSTTKPDPTTPPHQRRRPGSTTSDSSSRNTPPSCPNGSATPTFPTGPCPANNPCPAKQPLSGITDPSSDEVPAWSRNSNPNTASAAPHSARGLAPQMQHRHGAHAEAVARIGWCISERGLGVITGEVGAGKTVAVRAALTNLHSSRHTVIYLGNPAVGGRGLYGCIGTALDGTPRVQKQR